MADSYRCITCGQNFVTWFNLIVHQGGCDGSNDVLTQPGAAATQQVDIHAFMEELHRQFNQLTLRNLSPEEQLGLVMEAKNSVLKYYIRTRNVASNAIRFYCDLKRLKDEAVTRFNLAVRTEQTNTVSVDEHTDPSDAIVRSRALAIHAMQSEMSALSFCRRMVVLHQLIIENSISVVQMEREIIDFLLNSALKSREMYNSFLQRDLLSRIQRICTLNATVFAILQQNQTRNQLLIAQVVNEAERLTTEIEEYKNDATPATEQEMPSNYTQETDENTEANESTRRSSGIETDTPDCPEHEND